MLFDIARVTLITVQQTVRVCNISLDKFYYTVLLLPILRSSRMEQSYYSLLLNSKISSASEAAVLQHY